MGFNFLNVGILVLVIVLLAYHFCRSREVYLDNNGTTKPYKVVIEETKKAQLYGNASGKYATQAKDVLNSFRLKVKDVTGLNNHYVVITSGASESNNMIIRSMVDKYWLEHRSLPHILSSSVEHKTTLACLDELKHLGRCDYDLLDVDEYGRCTKDIKFRPNTCLLTVMHVNNETGCINDIGYFAIEAHKRGVHFHSDLAQSFGKIITVGELPPNLPNTSYSISMHKLHCGNVGCLIIDDKVLNADGIPLTTISGAQNNGLRGGTENIPQIAGALAGLEQHDFVIDKTLIQDLRKYLMEYIGPSINMYDIPTTRSVVFLSPSESVSTLLFSLANTYRYCNVKMREKLQDAGYIVSIGSTCNTDTKGASHVIIACGVPMRLRSGVLRVSVCNMTKRDDLEKFARKLSDICDKCVLKDI